MLLISLKISRKKRLELFFFKFKVEILIVHL